MVTTNPLASILDKNYLAGPNFTDWVRNLRIVLNSEKIGYVLDQKILDSFPKGGTQEEHVTYDKWCDDDLKVRTYMLASMNNELQKKYETMEDARSIILHLKEYFDENGRTSRYEISKALYQELARLNLVVDNELAVDLILQSLPDSFSGFVQNFHMHKMEKILAKLHSMLVVYEKEMHNTRPNVVSMAKASSSKSKTVLKKKKWKRPMKHAVQSKPKVEKGNCHYCGVKGHWRRNCRKYLASLKVKPKDQPCEESVNKQDIGAK
ncbi:uncharacterized protein LOC115693069 [Syzygium oleosum]|uniref:uncharacterized protein LOC115693069 n=1 Tax=Syzygium oleosum TaxID=219896 RepID=UPI0011D2714D|nr:uncharacterized protein LOC115693069 [Syzygium oleosum]